MSLIRNGGFENGTVEFWTVETDGTLEIDSSNQKYGAYCGKYTSSGHTFEDILSNDYISVTPHQLVNVFAWVKSAAYRTAYPLVYMYDADYSYMGLVSANGRTTGGAYLMLNTQYQVSKNCSYIRVGYRIGSSINGEVFYFDGYTVNVVSDECSISGVSILHERISETMSLDTTENKQDLKQFSTYYGEIRCTFASGTSPTLDVSVYELDEFDYEILLGSFTRLTSQGQERIDLPHTEGRSMYIKYTLGGTTPNFYFGVAVIGKK